MARIRRSGAADSVRRGTADSRLLAAVALCFLLSGFAALLYQAAWLKKLAIVFGTSDIAVATVLAAYMAGLAVGATVAARYAYLVKRPILVYGVLEAIIGISAVLVPILLDGAQALLVALYGGQPEPVAAEALGQNLYYLIATFLVLAIPTGAMGATLPLLSRYAVSKDRQVGPRIGLLYGINTAGAMFGALTAGFLLLPYVGLTATLVVGAAVNLLVFGIAAWLARIASKYRTLPDVSKSRSPSTAKVALHWIMPVMLVSGMVSFTLEVLWTRLLTHIFGGTVHAFAVMLACFLFGIALGGLVAGRLARSREVALPCFVVAQCLIAVVSCASYLAIDALLPQGSGLAARAAFAFVIIAPSTLFIGATYPLAVRIGTTGAREIANVSGRIYSWNTVGAIVGALLTGFVALPGLGFGLTLKTAMVTSCLLALLTAILTRTPVLRIRSLSPALVAAATAAGATALISVPERPDRLIYSHVAAQQQWGEEHFYGVGRSATILMREAEGFISLSSNGLSESAIGRRGMPPFNLSQKWLAGLPALARPDADSMLIVGLGGGIAIEGVPPHVEEIDVIELEPLVVTANRAVSALRGTDPLMDPRVNLVINDARNAITLTDKRYDLIVSQPSHPWTGGAAHLYTIEFLTLAKEHLNDGGVFLQWINSQFVDESLLQTLMATVVDRFTYVELYQPERQVLMFLASDEPIDLWTGSRGAATALADYSRHYNRMGLRAVEDTIAMMTLDADGVRSFAMGAPLNTDDRNLLAFFSRPQSDGLTADSMLELFERLDPLTNPQSEFHMDHVHDLAVHHIAERLLQANFVQRVFRMARASESPDVRAMFDALGYDHSGESERAEASFNLALRENPDNRAAQFGLLRMYLGGFAQAQVPAPIGQLANRQTGPDRRVLEGWVFGAAGAFDRLADLDEELAAVEPTSLAHPIAVKLRADWRVVAAQNEDDPAIAREALEILDDLLASYWNMDLYVLRSGLAFLAQDSHGFVESVSAAVRQLRQRLDALEHAGDVMPAQEATLLRSRLDGMLQRLSGPMTEPVRERAESVAEELRNVSQRL